MSIIQSNIFSITNSERETAVYLLRDLSVKQVKEMRCLSFEGVQSQTKRIREKMQAGTIYGALGRMIALNIITHNDLLLCLPDYLKPLANEPESIKITL